MIKKAAKPKFLSVIIPAYKQPRTIVRDLKNIKNVLEKIRYDYEIIVVVDGCRRTYQKAKKIKSAKLKIYYLSNNQGKGYTIRYGMEKAKGDYIAFLDAGMEIDPNGLSMLLEHLEWYNADIIVGSKRHLVSVVDYPTERKVLSWGYFYLVWLLFGIKIRDTQAGIKIFKRHVLEKVLPVLLIKEYAFDIEMLSVASRFGFQRIYEAPIKLKHHKFASLINKQILKIIWKMLWNTAAVFYRLKILKYYDKKIKNLEK